jgi:alpha-aminoadipic semialdehyde synthase
MKKLLGIRREDKNVWERRVPLIPAHVRKLKEEHGIETVVQPFERRAIPAQEYENAGAKIDENLSACNVIMAVKEIPVELLMEGKTYLFFSHVIKGQSYNMPMLSKLMELKCTLIDYECIKDETGRRLVFFGRFAGLAGMIDALHGYGKRLLHLGYKTPFLNIKPAYEYEDIESAKNEVLKVGEEISLNGLPEVKSPYVFGFAGYGNVSKGAQEIFDCLPHEEITPDELINMNAFSSKLIYKVVFKEEDMVEPVNAGLKFELQDYYDNPENYKSSFDKFLPHLSLLVNAIYWTEDYPRFVTKDFLKSNPDLKLEVIGDITCDINGAIEITHKATESDNPAYVYNPRDDSFRDGYAGEGVVDIAVDNLPAELPRDASGEFSYRLIEFVPGIMNADLKRSFEEVNFPPEIKRAVILYKGKLTSEFKYLEEFLG